MRLPVGRRVAVALSSPTGIGWATPYPAAPHAMRRITKPAPVRSLWIETRAMHIVLRIIPNRTPFTHLTRHPMYPAPAHISKIPCCRSWSSPSGRYAGRARRKVGTVHRGCALHRSTSYARRHAYERRSLLSHQHSGTFLLPRYSPRERYFVVGHAPHAPILLLLGDVQPPTDNWPRHLPTSELTGSGNVPGRGRPSSQAQFFSV
jgi:hypothetical protein